MLRRCPGTAARLVRRGDQGDLAQPQDIKDQHASASVCGNNRVAFNIGGNKYQLVVEVQYQAGILWVKFVGTHVQYDRIDVETVNDH